MKKRKHAATNPPFPQDRHGRPPHALSTAYPYAPFQMTCNPKVLDLKSLHLALKCFQRVQSKTCQTSHFYRPNNDEKEDCELEDAKMTHIWKERYGPSTVLINDIETLLKHEEERRRDKGHDQDFKCQEEESHYQEEPKEGMERRGGASQTKKLSSIENESNIQAASGDSTMSSSQSTTKEKDRTIHTKKNTSTTLVQNEQCSNTQESNKVQKRKLQSKSLDSTPKSRRKLQMSSVEAEVKNTAIDRNDDESCQQYPSSTSNTSCLERTKIVQPHHGTKSTTHTKVATTPNQSWNTSTRTPNKLMTPQSSISFRNSFGGRVKNLGSSCSSHPSRFGSSGSGRRRRRKLYGSKSGTTTSTSSTSAFLETWHSPLVKCQAKRDHDSNTREGILSITEALGGSGDVFKQNQEGSAVEINSFTNMEGEKHHGEEDEFVFHSQSSQPDGILF